MKIGTKSVLFGAHQFLIHPLFVALAWWQLYGFPWDPRLWVAFFVHDLGYLGKPNMDGPEGEEHPRLGARIMSALFDWRDQWGHRWPLQPWFTRWIGGTCDLVWGRCPEGRTWYCVAFYHSRFLAKRYEISHSRLCVADKLAGCLEPDWLYLPRVIATGEIAEYMGHATMKEGGKYGAENIDASGSRRAWRRSVKAYLLAWVAEHRDGRDDTWTPAPGKPAGCPQCGGCGIVQRHPFCITCDCGAAKESEVA